MKDGDNLHAGRFHPVKHTLRKACNGCRADVCEDDSVQERIYCDPLEDFPYSICKGDTQARP